MIVMMITIVLLLSQTSKAGVRGGGRESERERQTDRQTDRQKE